MPTLKYDITVLIGLVSVGYGLHTIHVSLAFIFAGSITIYAGITRYRTQKKVDD